MTNRINKLLAPLEELIITSFSRRWGFLTGLAVGISIFALTSWSFAQEEQWLQYHSSREVSQVAGGMYYRSLELSTEKPSGVELPQFSVRSPEDKGENQFFAKWSTPMAKNGFLWLSLDRTQKYGLHDLLYIDSNGNGRLNDEEAVKAYRMEQYYSYFGPVKVIFQLKDGPVTYHLNFQFYSNNDRNRLYAFSGCWYDGDITVAGTKKYCALFDYNTNGTFNDKSLEFYQCDRIRIGRKDDRDNRFVGNFIEVDGTLYWPEIARDGACIKLAKAEDVKFGSVRLPEPITEFSAGGENGLFIFEPKERVGRLPVGKYRINYWAIGRKDEKGTQWEMRGSGFSRKGIFDITADGETELSVGEPVVFPLTAQLREGTYSFRLSMRGRDEESISLTRNKVQPQAPKLHIKNEDGTYDRTFSLEYG
jgi:hypothetical protein